MRRTFVLVASMVGACAGGSPPQSTAPVASTTAIASSSASDPKAVESSSATPSASASSAPKAASGPCSGDDLVLETVFANEKCRVFDKMDTEIDGPLESELTADPPKVAPGATTTLKLVLKNTSKSTVNITVALRQVLRPAIYVRDAQGKTIAPPAGKPSMKPNPVCASVDCAFVSMRASIVAGGKATWSVPWKASKVAWPKGPVLEACCESGTDPVIGGPLPAGSYEIALALGAPKTASITKIVVGP